MLTAAGCIEHFRQYLGANQAARDCLVTAYGPLIPGLTLPDADNRHVLAAAVVGRCDVIVTQNLRNFPEEALVPFHIEAVHPDESLSQHLDLAPGLFYSVIRRVRARLVNPPYGVDEYLATLTRQGPAAAVGKWQVFAKLL